MKNTNIKLQELIAKLEDAVNTHWKGKRIESADALHSSIHELITPILKEHNLKYSTWHVMDADDIWERLMNMRLDYKQDGRIKYGLVGRFNKVTFEPKEEVSADAKLIDLSIAIEKKRNIENLERLKREREELLKDLEEHNKYIAQLEEKLNVKS